MRARAPRAVADLLATAVPQLRDRLLEFEIRRAWSAVVGTDVARRARPQSLAAGRLTVVADNSPWPQEPTLRSGEPTERPPGRFAPITPPRPPPCPPAAPPPAPPEP